MSNDNELNTNTRQLPAAIIAGIAAGMFIVKFPLSLSTLAVAGAVAMLLTVLRPDWALYLFFCGTIILTDFLSPLNSNHFSIPDADLIQGLPSGLTSFFIFLLFVTLVRTLIMERQTLPISIRGLIIYAVILIIALGTGIIRGADMGLIQVDFIDMFFPVLCFYLCLIILDSRKKIYRLLTCMMVAATLKAIILIAFYLVGRGWPYVYDRIVSLDSADLLAFITLGLIAIHLMIRGDLRGGRAALVSAACLPMLFAIIFSYRRAQWVGVVFSSGLLFLGASRRIRSKLAVTLAITLCVAGTAIAALTSGNNATLTRLSTRILSITDKTESSNFYHLEESKQVLRDLSESPLFGLGLGAHHTPLTLYKDDDVPTNVVHNTFLYVWMKLGLPGLLFFTWAGVAYGRRILSFRKTGTTHPDWGLILPLAASTGLWLAMFLTSPIPWYLHQTFMKALFVAIPIALMLQTSPPRMPCMSPALHPEKDLS